MLFLPFLRVNSLLAYNLSVIKTERVTILRISGPSPIKYQTFISKDPAFLQIELLNPEQEVTSKKWLIKEGGIEEIESIHKGILGFIGQKNFVKIKFTSSVLPYQIFPTENLITILIESAPQLEVKLQKTEPEASLSQKSPPQKKSSKRKVEGRKSHIVRSGENLYRIAKKYDVTVSEIQKANHLSNDTIFVGQRIVIPEIKKITPLAPLSEDKPEPEKPKTEPVVQKEEKVEKKPLLTEGIIAVVNEEVIFQSELEQEVKNVLERYGKEIPQEELKEVRKEILDKLIENKILLQQAKKEGIIPDREAIEEFKKQLTAMTLIEKEVDSKIKVTEDEIKSFYQEHQEDFTQPAGVKISEISLSVPSSEDEKGWNQAKIKMDLVKELCTDAESFAFLAYQQLKNKKEFFVQAGQFFPEVKLFPQVTEAIANLRNGESSEVIKTEKGYKIIHLDKRIPAQPLPLATVRPEIERIVFSQKREIYLKEWLSQLKKNSVIEKKED